MSKLTKQDIIKILGAIKTIYPYYAKDNQDIKLAVETWYSILSHYSSESVQISFKNTLKVCKMPPTPADIIEQINILEDSIETPNLFGELIKAADAYGRYRNELHYTFVDETGISQGEQARIKAKKIWDNLNPVIKEFLGSKAELERRAVTYTDDDWKYEQPRFNKMLPELKSRVNNYHLISKEFKRLTDKSSLNSKFEMLLNEDNDE